MVTGKVTPTIWLGETTHGRLLYICMAKGNSDAKSNGQRKS
jgi:hypothetical protein